MANEENQNETGFSADYVKELRSENASWRQKVRDLEVTQKQNDVKVELLKKGVEVNPSWVEITASESPSEAVDRFLTEYPQFTKEEQVEPEPKDKPIMPKPMTPNAPKTTNKGSPPQNATGREIEEIKKDPKARATLREHYRELLVNSSNRNLGD